MEDYILRATAAEGAVRAFAAVSRNTVETARQLHNTSPVATAALGRLLTAAAMIGSTLKSDSDLVTLQIKGDGSLQGIIATSDSSSRVKGYAFNPETPFAEKYPGKLDVGSAVGKGTLTVIKDIGLKEPYSGQIELVSGEIAEDLSYYYAKSEQTPSAIGLGVLIETDETVRQAGGFMIQLMPGAPEEVVDKLENKLNSMPYVTDLLDMGKMPEDILEMILGGMDLSVTDKMPMKFYCNCTRERVEKALVSIGKSELEKIINEDQKADVKCHFCSKEYHFDKSQLKNIYNKAIER